jgi:hypothetical protein
MLNWEDPGSTSASPEVEASFDAEGRLLTKRLAQELGGKAFVRYWRDTIEAN